MMPPLAGLMLADLLDAIGPMRPLIRLHFGGMPPPGADEEYQREQEAMRQRHRADEEKRETEGYLAGFRVGLARSGPALVSG